VDAEHAEPVVEVGAELLAGGARLEVELPMRFSRLAESM
jgi:hypothetical protein